MSQLSRSQKPISFFLRSAHQRAPGLSRTSGRGFDIYFVTATWEMGNRRLKVNEGVIKKLVILLTAITI